MESLKAVGTGFDISVELVMAFYALAAVAFLTPLL
jgi:hypothetical protein